MTEFDVLFFIVPFAIGLIIYFKSGHKFYSTTAVMLTGIALILYFKDIKPFWMSMVAFVLLWTLIFVIPQRLKK